VTRLRVDLADADAIAAASSEVVKSFGSVDVLVNNAGILSNNKKWVSPSLTLADGSAGNHGFSSDRAIGGGVDGDRLLGKAVEEEPAHL